MGRHTSPECHAPCTNTKVGRAQLIEERRRATDALREGHRPPLYTMLAAATARASGEHEASVVSYEVGPFQLSGRSAETRAHVDGLGKPSVNRSSQKHKDSHWLIALPRVIASQIVTRYNEKTGRRALMFQQPRAAGNQDSEVRRPAAVMSASRLPSALLTACHAASGPSDLRSGHG